MGKKPEVKNGAQQSANSNGKLGQSGQNVNSNTNDEKQNGTKKQEKPGTRQLNGNTNSGLKTIVKRSSREPAVTHRIQPHNNVNPNTGLVSRRGSKPP